MAVPAAVAHLASHEVKPLNKDSGNEKGVCKTRTGYLRMADADGNMRIEKCG